MHEATERDRTTNVWHRPGYFGRVLLWQRDYWEIDGERLQEIRMSRGLTLRRLEQHSGVPYELLNELELEGGVAEGDTVEQLAEALDVEPSELSAEDA